MQHLRLITPPDLSAQAIALLRDCPSTTNLIVLKGVAMQPEGDMVTCDVAEEDASYLIADLRRMGIPERGTIDVEKLEASISHGSRAAERQTAGTVADSVLWENVGERISTDGFLSWGLVALFALSGVIAVVGILIDSAPIVVGAMAVCPDFAPVAAFGLGVVRRRRGPVIGGFLSLAVGFTCAIALAYLAVVALRAVGIAPEFFIRRGNAIAEAITQPDGYSVVVALCAGAAGMLSMTLGRSSALVGVAISITTIPAAADIGLSLAYRDWEAFAGAGLQLALNVISLLIAATATLALQRGIFVRRARRRAEA